MSVDDKEGNRDAAIGSPLYDIVEDSRMSGKLNEEKILFVIWTSFIPEEIPYLGPIIVPIVEEICQEDSSALHGEECSIV